MTQAINFRWFKGKQVLALVRNNNYAHAGEDEGILKVFADFSQNKERTILDVGCGLGGTAKFIQDHGWGKVTATDIENAAIEHAKKNYPDIEFYTADVVDTPQVLPGRTFDIICLFNSFYAFPDQLLALSALKKLAHKNTQLIIFEYADLTPPNEPLKNLDGPNVSYLPVRPEKIGALLNQAGWQHPQVTMITDDYERWYDNLVQRIMTRKEEIIAKFDIASYEAAVKHYSGNVADIRNGRLGGCIVTATI